MRSGVSAPLALTDTGHGIQAFVRRQAGRVSGIGLFAGVAFALASLGTWNVADPSFSHATDSPVTNAMGYPGAVFSDLAMQFFGLSSVAALVPAVIWGFFFATARGVDSLPRRAAAWFGASLLFAAIAGCTTPPETWPLPSGLGGVFGDMVLKIPGVLTGGYPTGLFASVLAVLLLAPAICLFAYGSGLYARKNGFAVMSAPKSRKQGRRRGLRRRGRRRRGDTGARRDHPLVAVRAGLRAPHRREIPGAGRFRFRRPGPRERLASRRRAGRIGRACRSAGQRRRPRPRRTRILRRDGVGPFRIGRSGRSRRRTISRRRSATSAPTPRPASRLRPRARLPAPASSARRRPR